jgi:hypothetical protein
MASDPHAASKADKPRIKKTPNCRHLYTARLKGYGTYGWGNTPDEARAKLAEMIAQSGEKPAVARYAATTQDVGS